VQDSVRENEQIFREAFQEDFSPEETNDLLRHFAGLQTQGPRKVDAVLDH